MIKFFLACFAGLGAAGCGGGATGSCAVALIAGVLAFIGVVSL